jgi:two-component system response regulator DevR
MLRRRGDHFGDRRPRRHHVKTDATRVLIVEDHQVVADGLAALINDQPDMAVIGQAGSVADSLTRAAELQPDLVLIDFRLTDGTGADAAAGIRQMRPETKLIFLTREDSDAARFAALEAGASAFIHKSRAAQDVVDAIRKVAQGATLFTPRSIAQLLNSRREVEAQLERLTPREKEVLRLMAEGTSSRDIAQKLGISYTTVRTHIRSLGSKLGVHSKLEAIVKARELALVE